MADLKKNHQDAAIKGAALGILTYLGFKLGINEEVVVLLIPVVATGLSVLSTKIGDKNTALLLSVATKAIAASEAATKKAPAKKAASKKK